MGFDSGLRGRGSKLNYLGTEVGIAPTSIKYWDPLMLKIKNRLKDWNSYHLSIAGRLILLKASVDSLPSF